MAGLMRAAVSAPWMCKKIQTTNKNIIAHVHLLCVSASVASVQDKGVRGAPCAPCLSCKRRSVSSSVAPKEVTERILHNKRKGSISGLDGMHYRLLIETEMRSPDRRHFSITLSAIFVSASVLSVGNIDETGKFSHKQIHSKNARRILLSPILMYTLAEIVALNEAVHLHCLAGCGRTFLAYICKREVFEKV